MRTKYSLRLLAVAIPLLLAAVYLNSQVVDHRQELNEGTVQEAISKAKFTRQQISSTDRHKSTPHELVSSLVVKLRQGGYLNDEQPLYDFNDPKILAIYNRSIAETKAAAISRDITSWQEIQEAIASHVGHYGPGALIILSGAAPHIYGAILPLQKSLAVRYISTTPIKLTIADVQKNNSEDRSETRALDDLRVQIDRDIGVVKSLGYKDIETFLADCREGQDIKNIAIGIEETGLHSIYGRNDWREQKSLYGVLAEHLKEARPASILYIGEDLHIDNITRSYSDDNLKKYLADEKSRELFLGLPRDDFLILAKQIGIPVAFGAFGHRDRLRLISPLKLRDQ